jgi:16S rRNA (cytosine1402-N4)-methyltransferase
MKYNHVPVLLKEAIENLNLKKGDIVVDCTLGGGGYTRELSRIVGDSGRVLAIDADEMAIKNSEKINKELNIKNITLIHENFSNLKEIVEKSGLEAVDACVFDLGLSSAQFEDPSRGFSFNVDAPLVMEFDYDKERGSKTTTIVNKYSIEDLERIIRDYGEERMAGRVAKAIVKNRPFNTTKELADVIVEVLPKGYEKRRIHPATRTFQALRIETNNELKNLKSVLSQAVEVLKSKGRMSIVSFHSLEDRIVKQFFKTESIDCICPPKVPVCNCSHASQLKIITKKIISPSVEEVKNNLRARSAKLRVAEKI